MGLVDCVYWANVWPGSEGVYGQGQLSPKTVSPVDDANVGCVGLSQPYRHDQRRACCLGG